MKNKIIIALIAIVLIIAFLLSADSIRAQIFGGGVSVTGTQSSSSFATNIFYDASRQVSVYVSGVTDTNTTVVARVYKRIEGTTNAWLVTAQTNSCGTNSAISFTVPAVAIGFTNTTFLQISVGTNTATIYVP